MAAFYTFTNTGSEGKKKSFCSSLYNEVIIDDERKMNLWHIIICILSLCVTLFAYAIFRHNQNVSTKNNRINKNAILPLYQKLLLFYIISIIFTLIVWIFEYTFDSCWTANSTYWWLTILCAFQTSLKRFFELFIALFISGKSSGKIAIKQSIIRSFGIALILFIIYIFMYSTKYLNYPFSAEVFYIVSEVIYFTLLLSILWYCCCHHWLRMSNIYILLIATLILESLYIISWIMIRFDYDGYCLNDIGDLLEIIIFPILIIYVIRADSYFWRTIFQTLSQSTRIVKSFGGNKKSQQLSSRLSDGGFGYTPITDFLSMQVPIIDFANLKVGTNPVGHGSTSMVYPALLNGSQLVAVKVFSLDKITIKSVADFFRETLLSAEIDHANVVKFLGCCIRPPEICLVYEICSHGDLASFIFSQNKTLIEYSQNYTYNLPSVGTQFSDRIKPTSYNDEHSEFAIESTDTGHGNVALRGIEDLPSTPDISTKIDIIYQQPTLLSDNTTIPSGKNSPNFNHVVSPLNPRLLTPQRQKASVVTTTGGQSYKKPLQSPTDESSINTNKYSVMDRPHDEIINSLKAKMVNMGQNGHHMGNSVSVAQIVLNMNARLYLLLDISRGMAFLHKRNMLHRDLKTSNILVHYEVEQARFLAKVCDFGSSRYAYANTIESSSKGGGKKSRELSLTNYKNAATMRSKQKKTKRFPQILANVRKLRLNKNSQAIRNKNRKQNPFTYRNPRTASITEDSAFDQEQSQSVTASTRYGTWDATATNDHTFGNGRDTTSTGFTGKKWRDRSGLLPEPIRNLSTVAYTAPENLAHIDFATYEKLHEATVKATRTKIFPKSDGSSKPYYNKKKKKFTSKKPDGVLVTPQFERTAIGSSMSLENTEDCELSIASEPIEMHDDGVAKDRTVTKDRMIYGNSMNNLNIDSGNDRNDRLISGHDVDLKTAFKADVFSFAVIIWEVICMKPIYDEMNMIEIRDMILKGNRINLIEFEDLIYINVNKGKKEIERKKYRKIQQLMTDCWQQNAKLRPNFAEIVKIINAIIRDK